MLQFFKPLLNDFQTSILCRVPPQLGSEGLDAPFGSSEFQSDTAAEVSLYTFVCYVGFLLCNPIRTRETFTVTVLRVCLEPLFKHVCYSATVTLECQPEALMTMLWADPCRRFSNVGMSQLCNSPGCLGYGLSEHNPCSFQVLKDPGPKCIQLL